MTVLDFFINLLAFIIALGIAWAVVYLIRDPLFRFLSKLLGEDFAEMGVIFVSILIGLAGLSVALSFFKVTRVAPIISAIIDPLQMVVREIKWIIYIAALLFIAFSLRERLK